MNRATPAARAPPAHLCQSPWHLRRIAVIPPYGASVDAKLKHLEFIQAVIARLSKHSFLFKGWSLTIATALFALAAVHNKVALLFVALFSTLVFWGLDGYYLWLERGFVKLHETVAAKQEVDIDFSMSIDRSNAPLQWFKTCGRPHLVVFYMTIIVISFIEICFVRSK